MALPTDANVELVLCDDVRQTPEGKLDVSGYFPVHQVKVDPAMKLPVVINLCFVWVLKDGDGRFTATFRIEDPLGKELHRFEIQEFDKLDGPPHMILLQINRIPVAVSGNYAVLLEIGDEVYRRPVRIFQ